MCNCVEKANEAMVEHNCRVVTKTLINFNTGKSRESQPFVTLEKIEKSRKPLMTLLCNFCPFCGEKCT